MILCFDIGGTRIKYGIFSNDRLIFHDQIPTPTNSQTFFQIITKLFLKLQTNYLFTGVSISIPGCFDFRLKQIKCDSALEYIHTTSFVHELKAVFNLPMHLENDANCGGFAEIQEGYLKDQNLGIYLVVGTGIGGAIFLNNQLLKGAHNQASEFGLVQINDAIALKKYGTLVRIAQRFYEETNLPCSDGKVFFEYVNQKHPVALKLLQKMYDALATLLINLCVILDPKIIVVSGGLINQVEILEGLKSTFNQLGQICPRMQLNQIQIQKSKFNDHANLWGAYFYFKQQKNLF